MLLCPMGRYLCREVSLIHRDALRSNTPGKNNFADRVPQAMKLDLTTPLGAFSLSPEGPKGLLERSEGRACGTGLKAKVGRPRDLKTQHCNHRASQRDCSSPWCCKRLLVAPGCSSPSADRFGVGKLVTAGLSPQKNGAVAEGLLPVSQ